MSKVLKFAVIRAQHDSSVSGLADGDVRQMFFANANNSAVFQFWEQGFFDLSQSTLLARVVSFTIDFEKVDDRSNLAKHVFDQLTDAGEDLSSYDGFVFLVWPGGQVTVNNPRAAEPNQPATITRTIDGGTNSFGDGRKFCVLPVGTSNHMFFCHEVGHVARVEHTFGLLNNGIDWQGTGATGNVYGDPYDIMSSASFGDRGRGPVQWNSDPTFAGTPVSWPNAGAFQMGCAPARATRQGCGCRPRNEAAAADGRSSARNVGACPQMRAADTRLDSLAARFRRCSSLRRLSSWPRCTCSCRWRFSRLLPGAWSSVAS